MKSKILLLTLILILFSGCTSVAVVPEELVVTGKYHNGTTIITEDYFYAVGGGEVNSAEVWNKWGYNSDVDPGTEEIVAHFGGDKSFLLSQGEYLNISSNSAADTSGGSGAQAVYITGIDENFLEAQELVNLNGVTPVQSTTKFLGVNRMVVYLAGSSLENVGDITATSSNTNKPQAQIPSRSGTTQQAFFFTPINSTFLANYLHINVNKLAGGSAPRITIRGWVRSFNANADYEIFRVKIDTSVENTMELSPKTPFVIGSKQILYFTAESDTNNAIVSLRFSGLQKKHN